MTTNMQLQALDDVEQPVLLVVGKDEIPIFASKDLLMQIPVFESMLSSKSMFRESVDNSISLPEDKPSHWRKAIEFLRTKDCFPRLSTPSAMISSCLSASHLVPTLETPLFTVDYLGRLVKASAQDAGVGLLTLSDGTSEQLEDIVLLFRMADKYMWTEMMELLLYTYRPEPESYGQDILAIKSDLRDLSSNVPLPVTRFAEYKFDASHPKEKLLELMDQMYKVHSLAYDETKVNTPLGSANLNRWNNKPTYEVLDEFLKHNMTSEAWIVYQKMCEVRSQNAYQLQASLALEAWDCKHLSHGILERKWTMLDAEAAWAASMRNENLETAACSRPHPTSSSGRDRFSGNLFADGMVGDLIISIRIDKPRKGFVYGVVQRSQRWGFFKREDVRLLEPKTPELYFCSCCKEPRAPWTSQW
ncbi:hypothetical protein MMC13_007756 [Lambiella insularis]|nr:hypothetical protein [Lambiella insularis]